MEDMRTCFWVMRYWDGSASGKLWKQNRHWWCFAGETSRRRNETFIQSKCLVKAWQMEGGSLILRVALVTASSHTCGQSMLVVAPCLRRKQCSSLSSIRFPPQGPNFPPTLVKCRLPAWKSAFYHSIICLSSGHQLALRQSDLKATTPGVLQV